MAFFGNLKKMVHDTISKNIQELVSDNTEQILNNFIKDSSNSENLNKISTVIHEIINEKGSIGGLNNLIHQFNSVHLGHLIQSWIETDKNLFFSMEQVQAVFGQHWLKRISETIEINPTILKALISFFLPAVIKEVTKTNQQATQENINQFDITNFLTSMIK